MDRYLGYVFLWRKVASGDKVPSQPSQACIAIYKKTLTPLREPRNDHFSFPTENRVRACSDSLLPNSAGRVKVSVVYKEKFSWLGG